MPALGLERYCTEITEETSRFIATARQLAWSDTIPTCPEWTGAHLIGHVRQCFDWANAIVTSRAVEFVVPEGLDPADGDWTSQVAGMAKRALGSLGLAEDSDGWGPWMKDGAKSLNSAFRAAGMSTPLWAPYGEQHLAFWPRWALFEAALHRIDAELAQGRHGDLAADVAADLMDYWLGGLAAPESAAFRSPLCAELPGNGETLLFSSTDAPSTSAGSWTVTRIPSGIEVTEGQGKADVIVEASTSNLLLMLKRRIPATSNGIKVIGEETLLDHWLSHAIA